MLNLIIFSLSYFLILYSVLGYGLLIENIFNRKLISNNFGYLGLYGIFFLIIYSYFSHLFVPHNFIHNSIIIIFGFFYFLINLKKILKKKESFLIFLIIFLILFVSLFMFKAHDDFPYYHFPYTYYLNQNSIIIGIGQYNHGFRTPSSLFYLNSLFYLPFIKYHMFSMTAILIMGFSNFILIKKILNFFKNEKIDYISYLCLLFFLFINIFFYRIQEHGTDKSAQILILVLFLEIFLFIKFLENYKKNFGKIFILMGIIISLKSFYTLYLIFLLPLFLILFNLKKIYVMKEIFRNRFLIPFLLLLAILVFTNFLNSGCLVYPVQFTCFDNFQWSIGSSETLRMNNWYEQWSKAGAGPNFRVDNSEEYIKNFNWVSNWIDIYFFNKVSDFLLGLIFLIIILIFTFYTRSKTKIKFSQNNLIIYLFIFILFCEWFYNHPALRYGGYCLFVLLIFYPYSLILDSFNNKHKNLKKKFLILICISLVVFISRNFYRINKEIFVYKYEPFKNPFYELNDNHFRVHKQFNNLILNYNNCLNGKKCDEKLYKKVNRTVFKKYIFVNKK